MLRIAIIALVTVRTFGDSSNGEDPTMKNVKDTSRGGPFSQQYHYNSYGGGGMDEGSMNMGMNMGQGYNGLVIDLKTAMYLILGAMFVLLILAAMMSGKKGGEEESSSGWSSGNGGSNNAWSRSYNLAGITEHIISAIDRLYDTYVKDQ